MLSGGHLFLIIWLGPSSASARVLLRALDQASEVCPAAQVLVSLGRALLVTAWVAAWPAAASRWCPGTPSNTCTSLGGVCRRGNTQSVFFTWLGFPLSVFLEEGKFCLNKSLWHQLPSSSRLWSALWDSGLPAPDTIAEINL